MAQSNLDIIITAKNRASGELKKLDKEIGGLGGKFGNLGGKTAIALAGISAVGIAAVAVGKEIMSLRNAAQEQIAVENQLAAVIRSTGGAAGVTAAQVKDLSTQLQATTNYGDEATIAAQSLLLTFTKVGSDIFPRATRAIVDLSAAMRQDLKTSVYQVGKALNDPIAGITALSRAGIQFSDAQKTMIEGMVAVGNIAGAQKVILKELETQVKGSAAAQVDAVIQLQNAWGDLRQVVGGLVLPTIDAGLKDLTLQVQQLTRAMEIASGAKLIEPEQRAIMFDVRTQLFGITSDIRDLAANPPNFLEKIFHPDELRSLQFLAVELGEKFNQAAVAIGQPLLNLKALKRGVVEFAAISTALTGPLEQNSGDLDALTQAALNWSSGTGTAATSTDALKSQILNLVAAYQPLLSIIDQARSALLSSFKGTVGTVGVPVALTGYETALAEVKATVSLFDTQVVSQEQIDFTVAEIVQRYQEGNRALLKTATTLTTVNKAFEDIKSKVEGIISAALDPGVGVDPKKFLPRPDAVNEDAKRLADVVVNGYNSPWAEYLNNKFPKLFEGAFEGGNVQEMAAKVLLDFQDGLHPELIDKDAVKKRLRRMLVGEANIKQLANEISQEYVAEYGGNISDVKLATGKLLGATDQKANGAASGVSFSTSMLDAVVGSDVGGSIVSTIVDQTANKAALLKTSGATNGKTWGGAFLSTVKDSVPVALVGILVSLVLPEVVAKLQAEKSKTGTTD